MDAITHKLLAGIYVELLQQNLRAENVEDAGIDVSCDVEDVRDICCGVLDSIRLPDKARGINPLAGGKEGRVTEAQAKANTEAKAAQIKATAAKEKGRENNG